MKKAEETKAEDTKKVEDMPKVEDAPKAEDTTKEDTTPKEEEPKEDVVRTWRAKMNCQMPWRDFTKNETVDLKDSQVDARVKALFECLTPDKAKGAKRNPDIDVMISRLKAAKIPLKKNMGEKEIRSVFEQFLAKGSTASEISKDAQ